MTYAQQPERLNTTVGYLRHDDCSQLNNGRLDNCFIIQTFLHRYLFLPKKISLLNVRKITNFE